MDKKNNKWSFRPSRSSGPQVEEKASANFNYDPVHFIRSHSKNNDPADIQTQIWEVRFVSIAARFVVSALFLG